MHLYDSFVVYTFVLESVLDLTYGSVSVGLMLDSVNEILRYFVVNIGLRLMMVVLLL